MKTAMTMTEARELALKKQYSDSRVEPIGSDKGSNGEQWHFRQYSLEDRGYVTGYITVWADGRVHAQSVV